MLDKDNHKMKLLEDVNGKPSLTRHSAALLIVSIVLLAFYSEYTGNDIGENVTNLLAICFGACIGKTGVEHYGKNKNVKD